MAFFRHDYECPEHGVQEVEFRQPFGSYVPNSKRCRRGKDRDTRWHLMWKKLSRPVVRVVGGTTPVH